MRRSSRLKNAKALSSPSCRRRKLDARALVVLRQRVLPLLERRVHLRVRHRQEVVLQRGEVGLVPDLARRAQQVHVRDALAVPGARTLDDAVVEVALRPDEEALPLLAVGLGLEDLRQAREMVGVAVRHQDALDVLGARRRGAAKPAREVAREELIVAAVHENDLAVGRLDHGAVALLDVDEVHLEHVVLCLRPDDVGSLQAGRLRRLDEARLLHRQDAAVGLLVEVDGLDLDAGRGHADDRHLVTPCEGAEEFLPALLGPHIGQVHVDHALRAHRTPPGVPPAGRIRPGRCNAASITVSGARRPVHHSNASAPWWSSIPRPSSVGRPARAAAARNGVAGVDQVDEQAACGVARRRGRAGRCRRGRPTWCSRPAGRRAGGPPGAERASGTVSTPRAPRSSRSQAAAPRRARACGSRPRWRRSRPRPDSRRPRARCRPRRSAPRGRRASRTRPASERRNPRRVGVVADSRPRASVTVLTAPMRRACGVTSSSRGRACSLSGTVRFRPPMPSRRASSSAAGSASGLTRKRR